MELLELHNITKRYPGVTALDNVSISFREGEVHALVGENGAGKSTFIKTISGAVQPNEGEIVFDGVTYDHLTPQKSLELGISVVYQEMIQFEAMSVADNLFMSDGSDGGLFVNDGERNKKAAELLEKFQCHISPKTWIRELSMANRQIVEICKAILRKARVLILDEPTASITVEEQRRLFDVIKDLKKQGVTIIYISHRLDELFEICDRVSILRDGQYIKTIDIQDTDKQGLIKLMVGRELSENYPVKDNLPEEEVVLKIENPVLTDLLAQQPGYLRGYPSSKWNWLSAVLDGTIPFEDICRWINMSYEATKAKPGNKKPPLPKLEISG